MNKINQMYMMATTAIHKLGDISSGEPDLCRVDEEDEDNYYGNWITGFGFIGVRFPKSTTRHLTEEEVKHFNSQYYHSSNGLSFKLKVD